MRQEQRTPQAEARPPRLGTGAEVEVRCSFDGAWSRGFEIAEVIIEHGGATGYRLRRSSDNAVLPAIFPVDDIIPAQG
jgi:hypothetical protein